MPGVETLLPLAYSYGVSSGKLSEIHLSQLLSLNPAKLMGLYPQKGVIKIGADADLVIFDTSRKVTLSHKNLHSNCDWSPYEGFELVGYPVMTLSRGKIVFERGEFTGDFSHGRFVKRGKLSF